MVDDRNRTSSSRGTAESAPLTRTIGTRLDGLIALPSLPKDGRTAAALRANLNAHLGAIALMDRIYSAVGGLTAGQVSFYETEARRESEANILHAREIADNQRKKEVHESELAALEAQHRFEAVRDFKEDKFNVGHARYRQRAAEAKVSEAVAREGLKDDILEPHSNRTDAKAPIMAEQFARLVDDLEKEIEEAEAAGRPTDGMRAEQNTLNRLLRRELLKGSS